MKTLQYIIATWRLLLKNWWKIGLVCFIVGSISIVYIFSIPRCFKSEVIMLPEVNSGTSLSGGLSSLASMAGVKLGSGSSEDAIYPEFYPKVLGTPEFLCGLLREKVTPSKDKSEMSLFDYLTKHQASAWWEEYLSSEDEKEKKEPLTPDINPLRLTKKQEGLLNSLKGSITSFVDKRTNMVTIDVLMQDPEVAAQVATAVQEKLQSYIVDYRTSKARNDVEYMEKITAEALAKYVEAQKVYADFADANQDLVLVSAQQKEEQLENEMQLAYNAYSQSMQQLQLAQAKVQERTPAFTILQPAGVPVKPTTPKRVVFVGMMLILSFFFSSCYFIIRDTIKRYRQRQNETEKPLASDDSAAENEREEEIDVIVEEVLESESNQ